MTYNTGINSAATNSGLAPTSFAAGNLSFPLSDSSDAVGFAVTLQGPTLGKDLNVTIKFETDSAKLQANYANDGLIYNALPDSTYTFSSNTGVIKKGTTYAAFKLIVYPNKLDGSKNYMLPISATTDDANVPFSTNYQTIYVHTIGNLLAGAYNWTYWRFNQTGSSMPDTTVYPASTDLSPGLFAPDNSEIVEIGTGYGQTVGIHCRYQLTFTTAPTIAELTNFKVKINAKDVSDTTDPSSLVSQGIALATDAKFLKLDPLSGHYKMAFMVVNGSGNARYLVDEFKLP